MEKDIKILRIRFKENYFFGDMEIDFTNNGKPVDTILIAGENGSGKSTLLRIIYGLFGGRSVDGIYEVDFLVNGKLITGHFEYKHGGGNIQYSYPMTHTISAIYSDVAINYDKRSAITSVTNLNIDQNIGSMKSSANLAQEIEQLLIDIYDLDANDYYREAMEAKERHVALESIPLDRRIARFINAYNYMFGGKLIWKGPDNVDSKQIYFEDKNQNKIALGNLSSGEKQIVFRGGFLLKNKNSLSGAIVLIDEPEISLHPEWQKKIMNYYKNIFTNVNGEQTSQIFAVTHSPFIIHNENRYNDKVIVLKRDENGKVYVEDKPEYYSCNNIIAIEDAFNINDFNYEKPTLYVEGRTDELYLNKAAEIFSINLPFEIKWVGHIDKNGQEEFTGKDSLNRLKSFLVGHAKTETLLLYDSDTNKPDEDIEKVHVRSVSKYVNKKNIKVGIENALLLDNFDISGFYSTRKEIDNYGGSKEFRDFEKMKMCKCLCEEVGEDIQREVFANLKGELQKLVAIFDKE